MGKMCHRRQLSIVLLQSANFSSFFSFLMYCCNWLHRLELLRQAQAKDGNSGHELTGEQPVGIELPRRVHSLLPIVTTFNHQSHLQYQ